MANKAEADALMADITKMMTDPNAATDDKKITQIMKKIRVLDGKKASDQLRLAACHFMTMYHTRKAMTIGMQGQGGQQQNPMMMDPFGGMGNQQSQTGGANDLVNLAAVEKFKENQRKDMLLGWKLLDIRGSNSTAARTARVLRIEVAQRLEDSVKLKEAFDDLMKRQLSEEEVMVAFTAAPFLGDWKSMMKLGRKIEKMPGGLEQLHMMSLQLPIPDFTLVYELAKKHSLDKKKQPNVNTLSWDLLNVSKIRVKFKDVDCGQFEEKREELLAEIKKQGEIEWEDVPNCSHVHVKRMGSLCQAVSFGEIPMMLNGPWLEKKIHVKGRAEMPLMPEEAQMAMQQNPYGMPSPDQMTILIQEEEWNLTQDENDDNVFKGKYTLKQRPELPPNKKITPEHAPVNMEFECEIYLGDKKDDDDNNNDKSTNNDNNNNTNNDNNSNNNNNNNVSSVTQDDDEKIDDDEDDDEVDPQLVTEFDGLELD